MKSKLYILAILSVTAVCIFYLLYSGERKKLNHYNSQSLRENEIPKLLDHPSQSRPDKEMQKFSETWEKLSKALKENPSGSATRLKLAELYIAEARISGEHPYYYPAALKMINSVLASGPKDKNTVFNALSLKATVQLSLHQFEEGLRTAKQAVLLNPYNSAVYGALVDGNVELGHYEDAVAMADKMVSIRPDLRSYSRISYLREIHGDIKGAIEAMDMAVKAGYPGYESTCWARFTLGKIYENYGELSNAEMQYQIALMERPGYAFALDGLASLEMKKGNMQKAEMLLKKAAGIMPEISFHSGLAHLYLNTGRKAEAEKVSENILSMMMEDEKSGHVMNLEKARVYLELQGDPDKALSIALQEYKVRPGNIDVNLLMGKILVEKGRYAEAEKYLDAASVTGSKNPDLLKYRKIVELKAFSNK